MDKVHRSHHQVNWGHMFVGRCLEAKFTPSGVWGCRWVYWDILDFFEEFSWQKSDVSSCVQKCFDTSMWCLIINERYNFIAIPFSKRWPRRFLLIWCLLGKWQTTKTELFGSILSAGVCWRFLWFDRSSVKSGSVLGAQVGFLGLSEVIGATVLQGQV